MGCEVKHYSLNDLVVTERSLEALCHLSRNE